MDQEGWGAVIDDGGGRVMSSALDARNAAGWVSVEDESPSVPSQPGCAFEGYGDSERADGDAPRGAIPHLPHRRPIRGGYTPRQRPPSPSSSSSPEDAFRYSLVFALPPPISTSMFAAPLLVPASAFAPDRPFLIAAPETSAASQRKG
ncbi:hypothetical protein MSAN_01641700 [Mycena sanguinolenta]|uniref:Uncharacterized protein n=1 Tax=Mycena sanguinolenta TaxID=230812 RepID=A0A8H7CWP7_9AGAR|nr:hypothetical protein MSAN_01641700 [Mycena sanguinolenta]